MGQIQRAPMTGQRLSALKSIPSNAMVGAGPIHELVEEVYALRGELKAAQADLPALLNEVEYLKGRFTEAERLTQAFARASMAGRRAFEDGADE